MFKHLIIDDFFPEYNLNFPYFKCMVFNKKWLTGLIHSVYICTLFIVENITLFKSVYYSD